MFSIIIPNWSKKSKEEEVIDQGQRNQWATVYEQHWLHARHVENERLWMTNVFALIVAALLAFLGNVEDKELFSQVAICAGCFIFIISMLGYLLCLTWRAPFVEHTTLARKMLEDTLLKGYSPYTSLVYKRIKIGWITAHELFLYFYALMAGGALFLLLYVGLAWCYWWVSIMLSITLCALWRGWLARREDKYRKKMGVDKW